MTPPVRSEPRPQPLLAFDLETTGISPREHRIVAVGLANEDGEEVQIASQPTSEIALVSDALLAIHSHMLDPGVVLSWAGLSFDFPFLHTRAAILGLRIPYPPQTVLQKYRIAPHCDLCSLLTNWNIKKGETMVAWLKAFGIEHDDELAGKDIPALVDTGDWDAIREHCRKDVASLYALGVKVQKSGML